MVPLSRALEPQRRLTSACSCRAVCHTLGSAFLKLQAMLEPGRGHFATESERVQEDRDDDGDPPDPSSAR
jgi:hypothetical protein